MNLLEQYAYDIPAALIAKRPAYPRDGARLLIYTAATDTIVLDHFRNIGDHLPENSFLVLNKTRVVPARLPMEKETGGRLTALFLLNEPEGQPHTIRALFDRGATVGSLVRLGPDLLARIILQEKNIFTLRLPFGRDDLIRLLERRGSMPVPPYIKDHHLSERKLRERYQTIFAADNGSAAAPTASLHFTPRVFKDLARRGVSKEFLTLHVGLGTFAPVTEENIREKKLHEEYFEVSAASALAVNKLKNKGRPLVAVGTTTVRALESAGAGGRLRPGLDRTGLFILPGHRFRMVDALITNFHVPRSSLMMLVDAFLQHKKAKRRILDLYRYAIREKFRFFSFGDAMLIR